MNKKQVHVVNTFIHPTATLPILPGNRVFLPSPPPPPLLLSSSTPLHKQVGWGGGRGECLLQRGHPPSHKLTRPLRGGKGGLRSHEAKHPRKAGEGGGGDGTTLPRAPHVVSSQSLPISDGAATIRLTRKSAKILLLFACSSGSTAEKRSLPFSFLPLFPHSLQNLPQYPLPPLCPCLPFPPLLSPSPVPLSSRSPSIVLKSSRQLGETISGKLS
jgi:hypothetical protein